MGLGSLRLAVVASEVAALSAQYPCISGKLRARPQLRSPPYNLAAMHRYVEVHRRHPSPSQRACSVPVWPPLSVSGPAIPRLPPPPTAPDSAICSLTPLRGRGNSLDAGSSALASPRSSALTALLPAVHIPSPLRRAESLPVPPKGSHPAYMH